MTRRNSFWRYAFALLFLPAISIFLTTCGGKGGEGGTVDTVPPSILSTSPANEATGVAINSTITVTFSEPMDSSTINASTFSVYYGSSSISGSVSCIGATAIFTPSASWSFSTPYTVSINTGVKDIAGNALSANHNWSFTTSAVADTTPPTVTSTNPATNQTGVAINSSISATFSEGINPSTMNTATFTLQAGSTSVTGTIALTGNTATFTPSTALSSNTTYTATITTGVIDLTGNPLMNNYAWSFSTMLSYGGTTFFQENFEDTNFAARGWYESSGGTLSSSEHIPSSTRSLECRFLQGGQTCSSGNPKRHKFPESESVYVGYWVKYSPNYTGSNRPYQPHEFLILTNLDGDWVGPAFTHLTAYIEQNEGTPHLSLQDGKNIDITKIGQNLVNLTENRAIAGCNGDSDGHGNGDCYPVGGGEYWNFKNYNAGKIYFSDSLGPYYKSHWHYIEAYFKMNSISGGKGIADGIIQYWFDGELVVNYNNIIIRTGQYPNMRFNQFLIGPWIDSGSPVDQTFWIDDLTVASSKPAVSPLIP